MHNLDNYIWAHEGKFDNFQTKNLQAIQSLPSCESLHFSMKRAIFPPGPHISLNAVHEHLVGASSPWYAYHSGIKASLARN